MRALGDRPEAIEGLEADFVRADRSSGRSLLVMLGLLVASGSASVWRVSAGGELDALLLFAPAVAGFAWMIRCFNARETAWDRLDAAFRRWIEGTGWKTPAGAVGVAISAHGRGRRIELAFPSGIVQTYDRSALVPAVAAGEEGR